MKTINKSDKTKDHEYERDRKRNESECNNRQCVYKYTLSNTLNTFQINQQQQAKGIDKYAKASSR